MLPNDKKPWAKTLARAVIGATLVALGLLAYFLHAHDSLHIPEIVGIFLLFLTIVPPNLAVIYPWLLPTQHVPANTHNRTSKSTAR
jgi:fatty acid desaturase